MTRHQAIVAGVASHFGGQPYLREALSGTATALRARAVAFIDLSKTEVQTRSADELNAGLDALGKATESAIIAADAVYEAALSRSTSAPEMRLTPTQAHAVAYCIVRQRLPQDNTSAATHAQALEAVHKAIADYASLPLAKVREFIDLELARTPKSPTGDRKSRELESSDFARPGQSDADDDADLLKVTITNGSAKPPSQ